MKVTKLNIRDFKNIDLAELALGDVNCIEAKNHTGKTNTAAAIYWAITGKQLDGRTDDPSIKPIGKEQPEVSVKLTIEATPGSIHSIEKTYKESWTKAKGSGELTMTGHETIYKIDDIKAKKNTDALREINELLGVNTAAFNKISGFDPYQAIMNPLYIGSICDWKVTRQLIVENIIGDISNEDVMQAAPEAESARSLLEAYGYKVDKVVTYCKQQMSELTKRITELEAQRDLLLNTSDIPAEEMQRLEAEIDMNKKAIAALQNNEAASDPMIEAKTKERDKLVAEKRELYMKEHDEYMARIEKAGGSVEEARKIKEEKFKAYNQMVNAASAAERATQENYRLVDKLQSKLQALIVKREELLNAYKELKHEEMPELPAMVCPHCGAIINETEVEEFKLNWTKKHDDKINANIAEGKRIKLEMDDLKLQIQQAQSKNAELEYKETAAKEAKEAANEQYKIAAEKYSEELESTPKMADFKPSQAWYDLTDKIQAINDELSSLKESTGNSELEKETKMLELKRKVDDLKNQQGQHYVYLNAQREAENLTAQIKVHQKTRLSLEISKEAAKNFNKTKLDILESRLEEHFGKEIKWVLVKENIKEGSWDNVCYPLIVGTDTPFANGSTSEKVMTGIKIIEVFKRELELPDLPIIIDEIGELDSDSIANLKNLTKAQIIATRVNDKYSTPTLVQL